jgi:hypothetical protein
MLFVLGKGLYVQILVPWFWMCEVKQVYIMGGKQKRKAGFGFVLKMA